MMKGKPDIELIEFVSHFSEDGFDFNRLDMRTRTPLHTAVLSGDNGVIQGLINAGCDVDALDSEGFSPFVLALKEDNFEAVNILTDAGVDLTTGAGNFGSALNVAVLKSEPKLVMKLLKAGIDPNQADYRGNTSLHSLLEVFDRHKHRNKIIGDLLIQYGAFLNVENLDKWSPVHAAAKEKQVEAIK